MVVRRQLRLITVLVALLILLTVSGCMYGSRIKQTGAPASGEYLELVQNAMELYRAKTGVLPIRNKDGDTPEFERYLLDFKKLMDARILISVPVNAFENGGTAMYVVTRTESVPAVKLLDLVSYQQTADLQRAVDGYAGGHSGKLPSGESVSPGYWLVDYALLNRKEERAQSPYSSRKLHFLINSSGRVGIDFAPEIQVFIRDHNLSPEADKDLRELLLDNGHYVPAASFAYYWSGEAPVPVFP
jgi:hypothetical protein